MSPSSASSDESPAVVKRARFTVVELTTLALLAAMLVAAKAFLRVPIKVPGHTGIFWMAVLVVGKNVVRRPTTGTLIGLVSGILSVAINPGREGVFVAAKYIAAGSAIDLMLPLVGGRLDRWVPAALAGAVSNAAKLVTSLGVSLALGIPVGYIALGLGYAALTHVAFGAIGGWLGAVVFDRLLRARIPQLRHLEPVPAEEGD